MSGYLALLSLRAPAFDLYEVTLDAELSAAERILTDRHNLSRKGPAAGPAPVAVPGSKRQGPSMGAPAAQGPRHEIALHWLTQVEDETAV